MGIPEKVRVIRGLSFTDAHSRGGKGTGQQGRQSLPFSGVETRAALVGEGRRGRYRVERRAYLRRNTTQKSQLRCSLLSLVQCVLHINQLRSVNAIARSSYLSDGGIKTIPKFLHCDESADIKEGSSRRRSYLRQI